MFTIKREEGTLPKYSSRKKSKLIRLSFISAILATLLVYLFIAYNPLQNFSSPKEEDYESAFNKYIQSINLGDRRTIISRLSPAFKGGINQKRELIASYEKLKGQNLKPEITSTRSKGNFQYVSYKLFINEKPVQITNEVWEINKIEGKWYLLKAGNGLNTIGQSSSVVATEKGSKSLPNEQRGLFVTEKMVSEGVSSILSIRELRSIIDKIKPSPFYGIFRELLDSNKISKVEQLFLERAITTLFGKNALIAHYKSSNNFLSVSEVNGSVSLLSPLAEKLIKYFFPEIGVSKVVYQKNELIKLSEKGVLYFYTFIDNTFIFSDSELLIKNSIDIALNKKENSILNNTKFFAQLAEIKQNYTYYLISNDSDLSSYGSDGEPLINKNLMGESLIVSGVLQNNVLSSEMKVELGKDVDKSFFTNTLNKEKVDSFLSLLPSNTLLFSSFSIGLKELLKSDVAQSKDTKMFSGFLNNSPELSKQMNDFSNQTSFAFIKGKGTTFFDFILPALFFELKEGKGKEVYNAIKNDFQLVESSHY
ncbi:MAG: hypothetical protein HQK84_08565, partial [Nitrospinae bacterium]|nr:hypothetical protein [Nitrospinota bacterium]